MPVGQICRHDRGDLGSAQHQGPGSAIGTDQPLPGLARDNAIPVRRTLPGLLIDHLLRLHVALIEIDEDIIGAEEAELPQIAR